MKHEDELGIGGMLFALAFIVILMYCIAGIAGFLN